MYVLSTYARIIVFYLEEGEVFHYIRDFFFAKPFYKRLETLIRIKIYNNFVQHITQFKPNSYIRLFQQYWQTVQRKLFHTSSLKHKVPLFHLD